MDKAFLLISCELGKENEISSKLDEFSQVVDVLVTYGEYDLIAEIQDESSVLVDEFISTKIRKFENIRSTITLKVTC